MQEASFYNKQDGQAVRCLLCPHSCLIEKEERGKCNVRINREGKLFSENYGFPVSISMDPIEKKPLYHFFPGREILSVGTFGCNFSCSFCQNYTISQCSAADMPGLRYAGPGQVVEEAQGSSSGLAIAYTYNEPTVWYEYMYDIAVRAADRGIKNVVVSNGYINTPPLEKLLDVVHAFNIDVKSFSDKFYRDVSGGSLSPVKRSMKSIREKGLHLEITHLVVTGLNDNEEEFSEMRDWIAEELGEDTVLHLSRYFPSWKLNNPPTPLPVMQNFYRLACEKLNYVYLGNISAGSDGSNTICPGCHSLVVKRTGYSTELRALDSDGNCASCGKPIAITS